MANIRLKKTILEVVDNQLRDNDPPCTKKAYGQLMAAGYTEKEAKEKIGAVVLEEIYDVIKENAPFDEQQFEIAMTNMVQQCIDFEDDHRLPSEWDEIGELINQGQSCLFKNNYPGMTKAWLQAWQLTRGNVQQAEFPIGIHDLDEATDYEYSFEGWLQDMEMELSNAGEHEKRLQFCQEVLDTFVWNQEDYGGFKMAIGESLYAMKKEAEGRHWFESWLKEEPHNVDAVNGLVMCLQRTGEISEAFQIVENEIKGKSCTFENDILFVRAIELAEPAGAIECKDEFEKQYLKFQKEAAAWDPFFNDHQMPVRMPVRKAEKIYPNDKCPCGSGKKYKKCCGR